ncbi:ROK family protein [Nonomuraea sp. NPDC050790]|uniref:ROK family protein n=1 Tax=Nonomuraea sp. NPDC050790 TaxID=3364371 RepID=UPI0037A41EC5
MTGVAVGVSLDATGCTVLAKRLDSHAAADPVRLPHGLEGTTWPDAVLETTGRLIGELGEAATHLAAIGVAVPVAVDPRSGRPGSLPPWWPGDLDPAAVLSARLPEVCGPDAPRVLLDRASTLGALAEHIHCFRRAPLVVFVDVSRHVSAGIRTSDRIERGAHGRAGAVGHLVVRPDGRPCWCGNRGCLETYLNIDLMLADARRATRAPHASLAEVAGAAAGGDRSCRRILREGGELLGQALGAVCTVLNPSVIVVGGEVARAGGLFLNPCRAEMDRFTPDAAEVVASTLDDAPATGAMMLGITGHSWLTREARRGTPVTRDTRLESAHGRGGDHA